MSRTRCTLTRAITLHARHHYPQGGPATPHGHLYRIETTVRATGADTATIDLAALDAILTEHVAQRLGGSDLNVVIPGVASGAQLPTCETLAAWCWRTIADRLPAGADLERVRVAEDATLWADCTAA